MNKEKIIIGSDHAGYELKEKIKLYIVELGYDVEDIGTYSKESCDYPVIAKEAAGLIMKGTAQRSVLICGTGVGMCITANKSKGIRAVVCSDTTTAKFSRLHNNSNVLCLGQRITGEYLAKDICKIWLETEFEAQRHQYRLNLIEN